MLKTSFGFDAFKWLGDRVSEFLEHTNAGAIFVFGETYLDHFFAFSVSTIIYGQNSSLLFLQLLS